MLKRSALSAAFCLVAGCASQAPHPPSFQPLTKGEVALAQSIFGDQVNTAIVGKVFQPDERPDNMAATVSNRKLIFFHGEKYHSADYSQENRAFHYGIFLHEITHIWQNQTSQPGHCKQYPYPLAVHSRFSDYCREQQASIIEDYARRFLFPAASPSRNYISPTGQDTPDSDALLQKVVEDRFPQARKTRLALRTAAYPIKTADARLRR